MVPPWPNDPCRVCGQRTSRMHREVDCIIHLKERLDLAVGRIEALEEQVAALTKADDDGK